MKLIFGLGNPGKEYERTRHNAGWDAVTAVAEIICRGRPAHLPSGRPEGAHIGAPLPFSENKKFQSEIVKATVEDKKILFIHPLTFMNESGRAVLALKNFYKCEPRDILIVHDDMDLPVGDIMFTKKAGSAGHHGVASVQELLGTTEIARLRLGIGRRPVNGMPAHDFVLQKFHAQEENAVKEMIHKASLAIKDWIVLGVDKAMNTWNGV